MKFILGEKLGMSEQWNEKGEVEAITLIKCFPEDTDQTVDSFPAPGDKIKIIGTSKGKGFQGVVKRHNFAGGPKTHGHRHVLRSGGSIGSSFPEHVRKGKKMAGRMGNVQITVNNLKVAWIDQEKKLIAVKGAVPGRRGGQVKIMQS